uniref:Uncharacterized protein n=1 Tax=viral metagenome TaxID=1070528 RepID=A0A6C0L036_9ZZZZ|tara:strand:- start:3859 stop:4863 length:1005 start_codon:yes stop_codon:yes gene_type:complete
MKQDIGVFLGVTGKILNNLQKAVRSMVGKLTYWLMNNLKKSNSLEHNSSLDVFITIKKERLLSKVIDAWRYYTQNRGVITDSFYGRINAYDLKAIKAMVRKDDNPSRLIKYSLAIMFDFKGGFPQRKIWQQTSDPTLLRYIPFMPNSWLHISETPYNYTNYNLNSEQADIISRVALDVRQRSRFLKLRTYNDRINHLEEVSLKILRFLLKKGANPNDKYFLANMIFKHKYHSRTFLCKVISMCSHYGLESNTMLKALKLPWKKAYDSDLEYFIGPVLKNIHTNRLNVKDTIQLCYSWTSKKNLLKATNSNSGNLYKLNDDVLGIIHSFVYSFDY